MGSAPRAAWRPLLERLEDRLAPAVSLVTNLDLDNDGALDDVRIVGDPRNSVVVIADQSSVLPQLLINIDANGDGDEDDGNDVDNFVHPFQNDSVVIDVRLADGNDQFVYLVLGNLDAQQRLVSVNLGSGKDKFNLVADAVSITNHSLLLLDVAGGAGNDSADFEIDTVLQSAVTCRASLGTGNDTSAFNHGNMDDLAALEIDFDFGTGNNKFIGSFNAIGSTVGASVDLDFIGGDDATHQDDIVLQFNGSVGDGTLASTVSVDADLFAGNDRFVTGLDDGCSINVDSQIAIAARGGRGKDSLSVNLNTVFEIAAGGLLKTELLGGLDNDDIGVKTLSDNLVLDGLFQARLDGGAGNDLLETSLTSGADPDGDIDLQVLGGSGNDSIEFDIDFDPGFPPPGFDPVGKALLDGGTGADVVDFDDIFDPLFATVTRVETIVP